MGATRLLVRVVLSAWGLAVALLGMTLAYRGVVAGQAGLVVVGAVPLIVGALVLRRNVRKARSREAAASVPRTSAALSDVMTPAPALDYRSPAKTALTARQVYASVLDVAPLPRSLDEPGKTLASALSRPAYGAGTIPQLVGATIWTAFSLAFFVHAVTTRVWTGAFFLALFGAFGGKVGFDVVRRYLSRRRLPRVEVSEEPVFLGDRLKVHVAQPGPVTITRLRVDLVCREEVDFMEGSTSRTDEHEVFAEALLDERAVALAPGDVSRHLFDVEIPASAPHSFRAAHNAVAWHVRVRAELDAWPSYDERFELRVLPRPR